MKRQLPLALVLVLLALACVPAWASDGELSIVAVNAKGDECDYWIMKHRGKTQGQKFGSCALPLLQVYANLLCNGLA